MLPNILLADESKLVLYQKSDCIVIFPFSELEKIADKIENNKDLTLLERRCLKRSIFPFCDIVNFTFVDNNNIRVSLPKKVILKYNLLDRVMCKNIDNKIYLYNFSKFNSNVDSGIGKGK